MQHTFATYYTGNGGIYEFLLLRTDTLDRFIVFLLYIYNKQSTKIKYLILCLYCIIRTISADYASSSTAACAAAKRAIGTRNGEHEA